MSSDSWYDDSSWQNAGTREFLASVELWCPAKPTNTVRNLKVCALRCLRIKCAFLFTIQQPQLPRRVSDKRDSIGGVTLNSEERKLRGMFMKRSCQLLQESGLTDRACDRKAQLVSQPCQQPYCQRLLETSTV